ncbi:hypothetical protein B0H65DRAFT_141575 [Neurospora tetraspora]|uniref:Uncharacterized protein n=1 Tax=Neurospora tetraspora TaxID=94610 RepID=A0AAE0MUY4_9PEZI|nr:hypothetical protein B0H65DRAFT_141575 [Neurospora tetraspora]
MTPTGLLHSLRITSHIYVPPYHKLPQAASETRQNKHDLTSLTYLTDLTYLTHKQTITGTQLSSGVTVSTFVGSPCPGPFTSLAHSPALPSRYLGCPGFRFSSSVRQLQNQALFRCRLFQPPSTFVVCCCRAFPGLCRACRACRVGRDTTTTYTTF